MRVAILTNPIAGRGRARRFARELAEAIRRAGGRASVFERHDTDDEAPAALDAAVVAGGDGTLNRWLPKLISARVPFWHAPFGTENLFARAFTMDACPSRILRSIRARRVRRVDAAEANGRPFAIMLSAGPDAGIVAGVNARRRGTITHLSYAVPTLNALGGQALEPVGVDVDGTPVLNRPGMVVVANLSAYGMGLDPAWDAVADDGALDAVFLPGRRPASVAWRLAACWTREPALIPGRTAFRGVTISIRLAERTPVQLDGDPAPTDLAEAGTICCRALPGALRVLQPML
ncbi:MAG: diacylglycerol/lipid kinase family protein [Phycisphaerales bacterium]